MRARLVFKGASLAAILISGCSEIRDVHHQFQFGDPASSSSSPGSLSIITTDAQQRLIAVRRSKPIQVTDSAGNPITSEPWQLCAEPSPDTMTSLSASTAAAVKNDHVAAQLASAVATQAAMIGLRTQSITLMRDEAYRLCEAYMNGAIDRTYFDTLHRRFQNLMVANLAIEQLTGYARPPVIVIGGSAGADASNQLLEAQAALDKGNLDLKQKTTDRKKAESELQATTNDIKALDADGDGQADDKSKADQLAADKKKLPDLTAAVASAKKDEDDATTNVASLQATRDAARSPNATASSLPTKIEISSSGGPAISSTVAFAVDDIVTSAIDHDYSSDFCFDYISNLPAEKIPNNPVYKTCAQIVSTAGTKALQQQKEAENMMKTQGSQQTKPARHSKGK